MPPPSCASSLRTISRLIATSPHENLPQTAPNLLKILDGCGPVLSAAESHTTGKDTTDSSVSVHRYIVQLSALLNGKSFPARWTAVVLIKTTIELGGWELLRNSNVWVRGLLGIFAKPDPPATHGLAIVTLTKIYLLLQPHQTLKREITTPTLPQFIDSCLNLAGLRQSSGSRELDIFSPLLPSILDAFCALLPHHRTLFRPHLSRIGSLVSPLLAPTPSSSLSDDEQNTEARVLGAVTPQCSTAAQRLHVLLSHCAPQNTASEVWVKGLKVTISEVHRTANQVFRAVIENWEPIAGQLPYRPDARTFGNAVSDDGGGAMDLPGWIGIQAGTERLIGLLNLLNKYIGGPTAELVSLPLGSVMDVLTRVFSLTVPLVRGGHDPQEAAEFNSEITKEEREGLWAGLPQVHVAGMELLAMLVERLGEAFFPMVQGSLDQISWVFNAEGWDADVRMAAYIVLSRILIIAGTSLSKSSISSLSRMLKSCCCDLLPPQQQSLAAMNSSNLNVQNKKNHNSKQSSANADSFLAPPTLPSSSPQNSDPFPGLRQAAHSLLPVILLNIPSQHLRFSLRSQLDRTAILTQHKKAMIASVLFPPVTAGTGKARSSILPHLARSCPGDFEVEGLIRPRMPVIPTGKGSINDVCEGEDDEEEDYYSQGKPLRRASTNDALDAGPSQPDTMSGSNPPSRDQQDAQPPRSTSPVQIPEDPLPSFSSSKRLHDTTDPEGGEDQSDDHPRNFRRQHAPPSPKRLRVDPTTTDAGFEARNSAFTYPSSTESPALAPPPRPRLGSSEPAAPANALDVRASAGSAAATQASVDMESDGEFEIPELVMDADTDEAEDMDEDADGNG
ncbi:hypothetical protein GP486_004016 [Trichoglossum hirsutum]|uniref:Pre-rRNA-processing protein RIX1 n=1 Tax=Trichoglossum hirsutum TaxID=265104 RepID=A0A9P8RQD6_9PEZI|nr:hypothetical protein GP486_004016 [Trichoglossum hirsutum]